MNNLLHCVLSTHWNIILAGHISCLSADFWNWWWNKAPLATADSSISCSLYLMAPGRYEVQRRRYLDALQFVVLSENHTQRN